MKRLAIAMLVSAPALAHAHALPVGLELAWPASGAPVLLTNRGLVFEGQLRCNESYGVNTSAYPRVWLAPTHTVLVTQNSVLRTSDRGCTLTHALGLPDRSLSGFAAMDGVLLVSTLTVERGGAVYASMDQGVSFARWADNEPYEAFRELMFADPMRVYASGFRVEPSDGRVSYVWAVSDDGGRTWARRMMDEERLVLAVSGRDVVWAWDSQTGAVYRSTDAGATFVERLRVEGRPSLAVQGASVWVGAEGSDGVRVSRDGGETFAKVLPELTSVTCLIARGDQLHVCGVHYPIELGTWMLAVASDGPLREELMFADVASPVACAGTDTCALPWEDWSRELLTLPIASVVDASVVDAGVTVSVVDAGAPSEERESGCATRSGAGHAWMLVVAWLMRRRFSAARRR